MQTDRQTDRETDKYHQKMKHLCWWNIFDDMYRTGCRSFWFWFDVYLSVFDEHMH